MALFEGSGPLLVEQSPRCSLSDLFLGIDEGSEIYLVESWVASFGPMPHALENLILGVIPRRIDDEHWQSDQAADKVTWRAGHACGGARIPRDRTSGA
ncbi:hypothetical protein [Streptomyces noursei]|uniref:hypothetical protein n=1 Tax=Streptomyces noursei TaxID=1971 RepID=UPI001E3E109B|nr:hypothetical protein [Streptomyces noursei]MCZ1019630.1 hypothetical protein [Streptomyces noursei]